VLFVVHGAPVTIGSHLFDCAQCVNVFDCVAPCFGYVTEHFAPSVIFPLTSQIALSRSPCFVSPLDRVSLVLNSSFMPPRRNPPEQQPARQVMSQSERLTRSSSAPAGIIWSQKRRSRKWMKKSIKCCWKRIREPRNY